MYLHFAEEIRWSGSHYIPGHEKCGCIHGHTYFLRGLTIDISRVDLREDGISIDFGAIKNYFKKEWDHRFYVPIQAYPFWKNLMEGILKPYVYNNLKAVNFTTCEGMADRIIEELAQLVVSVTNLEMDDVRISFSLYEGPAQGVALD